VVLAIIAGGLYLAKDHIKSALFKSYTTTLTEDMSSGVNRAASSFKKLKDAF